MEVKYHLEAMPASEITESGWYWVESNLHGWRMTIVTVDVYGTPREMGLWSVIGGSPLAPDRMVLGPLRAPATTS